MAPDERYSIHMRLSDDTSVPGSDPRPQNRPANSVMNALIYATLSFKLLSLLLQVRSSIIILNYAVTEWYVHIIAQYILQIGGWQWVAGVVISRGHLTEQRRLAPVAVAHLQVVAGAVEHLRYVQWRHVQHDLLAVRRRDAPLTVVRLRYDDVIVVGRCLDRWRRRELAVAALHRRAALCARNVWMPQYRLQRHNKHRDCVTESTF